MVPRNENRADGTEFKMARIISGQSREPFRTLHIPRKQISFWARRLDADWAAPASAARSASFKPYGRTIVCAAEHFLSNCFSSSFGTLNKSQRASARPALRRSSHEANV